MGALKIKTKKFMDALTELSTDKGVTEERIKEAMIEAFNRSLIRLLKPVKKVVKVVNENGDSIEFEDPKVETVLGSKEIEFYQIKTVKNDKEITDDVLEIELDDAKVFDPKAEVGSEVKIPIDIQENESIGFINSFQSNFKKCLEKEEGDVLYEAYKDKIGTLVTGIIDRVEEKSISVILSSNGKQNIVVVPKRELIGNETFQLQESVTFLIDKLEDKKDSKEAETRTGLKITRASEGFLRKIIEDEIPEVEDGLIEIKKIARNAGRRSKVAVWSKDPEIDASGSVIGKAGARINAIMRRLGNGEMRERIDVLSYSPNVESFVAKALVPGEVLGVQMSKTEDGKDKAIVVVKDDEFLKILGKKAMNVQLAHRLTGVAIDIKKESQAKTDGITFKPIEQINAEEAERIDALVKEEYARKSEEYKEAQKVQTFVSPTKITESVDSRLTAEGLGKVYEQKQEKPAPAPAPKPIEKEEKEEEFVNVNTTTTLDSLEKALEVKVPENVKTHYTNAKKPRKISDEEVPYTKEEGKKEGTEEKPIAPGLSIYTEEELREFENEELNSGEVDEEDDINFDDYDDYYDDEDK